MAKIFFDTEFIDNQTTKTIDLISIGLVKENGQEYYAESSEVDLSQASEWVKQNVISKLTGPKKTRLQIAQEIQEFVGLMPEFWAWFGAYDWVALSQLYGTMLNVPFSWPNLYFEIVQFGRFKCNTIPNFKKMFPNDHAHNALDDARWNKKVWEWINQK